MGSVSSETERVYDDQIAPLLLKALSICKEHGLPIIAAVYYDGVNGDASGLTQWHPEEKPNAPWYLTRKAWAARGNIDQLCMNLAREVSPENNPSIVLRMIQEPPA